MTRRLQRLARARGESFASVVHEALSQYLTEPTSGGAPAIAGRFASGKSDTSARVDELLWRDPHA